MKRKSSRRLVEWQDVEKETIKGKPFDSEATYPNFNPALANPDILPATEVVTPSTPQLLMGEAIMHLQGRQREVYLLTMREDKSLAEVAQILKVSKGTVQMYKDRAIKFLVQYCESAIKKGRI